MNKIKQITAKIGGVTLTVLSLAHITPASALDFGFSFSNTIGSVGGTVTGRILGLNDNSTGPATQVFIDSFPAGLPGSFNSSNQATTWPTQAFNSFTVTGGSITAANFLAFVPGNSGLCLNSGGGSVCVAGASANSLTLNAGGSYTGNAGGFAGATYTPLASPPVSSVPFEFNEYLAVSTFLGVVGIGKLIEKLNNKSKDN